MSIHDAGDEQRRHPTHSSSSVPATLAPLFQEYRIESLDLESDRDLVIERVLARGDRGEVRWLLTTCGKASVSAWLKRDGARLLPRSRFVLWSIVFNGAAATPPRKSSTGLWPH